MPPSSFVPSPGMRGLLLLVGFAVALLAFLASSASAFGGGVGGGIGSVGSVGSVSIGAVGAGGGAGRAGGAGARGGRASGVNVAPAGVRIGGGAGATPPVVPRQTPKPRTLLAVGDENGGQGGGGGGPSSRDAYRAERADVRAERQEGRAERQEGREERQEGRRERRRGGAADAPAAASSSPAMAPSPSTSTKKKAKAAAAAAAAADAPASSSSCAASNGAPYDGCVALPSGGTFFWNTSSAGAASGDTNDATQQLVRGALEAPAGLGYSSFAFPSSPGAMVGAKALVLRKCADCPTGAALDSYSLDGKRGPMVVLDPAAVEVVSSSARALPNDGGLSAEFVARLPSVAGARDPSKVQWISASGPLKSDGVKPAIHTSYGDGVVDLASAPALRSGKSKKSAATAGAGTALTAGQLAADKLRRRRLHRAHAWLMVVAWVVLAPLAIGAAAKLRSVGGTVRMPGLSVPLLKLKVHRKDLAKWYVAHAALLAMTMALTACGLGTGLALRRDRDHGSKLAHEIIGYFICGAVAVQALWALFRPPNVAVARGGVSASRRRWVWSHRLLGLSTAVLAFANLILGLVLAERGAGLIALASVIWGGIVLAFAGKKAFDVAAAAKRDYDGGAGAGGEKVAPPPAIPSRWYTSILGGGGSRGSLSTKGGAATAAAAAAAVAAPEEVELGASNGYNKA